jgi:Uma2 family endonuclease
MATKNHANIIRNLVRTLTIALDDDLFLVYSQNPEIYISLSGNYRIPDVGVTPSEEDSVWEKEKLLNPLVVIEVLSPSNKGEEFEAKIADYRSIPSLKEYWLVSQKSCSIERFVRNEEDEWDCFSYKSVDEEIAIDILGITLSVEKVYKKIAF